MQQRKCTPVGNSLASSPIVASMISSSVLAIQFTSPPARGEHGAKTNSSIEALSSAYLPYLEGEGGEFSSEIFRGPDEYRGSSRHSDVAASFGVLLAGRAHVRVDRKQRGA